MKPTFALDFRNDAIALLHRTARGWTLVGQVALDATDLVDALGYLRSTALGLSPRGLTTKLVIPNSQVLYTNVRAPGPEAARRRKQVARALEGRTPYPVDDLVFDVSGNGPDVMVAVIARETLAEAEAFAVEHRFNPVSFVAVPDDGQFAGEAWFGPTAGSASLLTDGQKVERDSEPLVILSRGVKTPGKTADAAPDAADAAAANDAADDAPDAAPQSTTELAPAQPDPLARREPSQPAPDTAAPDIAAELPPDVAQTNVADASSWLASDQTPDDLTNLRQSAEAHPTDPHPTETPQAERPASAPSADPIPADAPPASAPAIAASLEPEEILARDAADLHDARASAAQPEAPMVDEAPMALDVVDDLPDNGPAPPPEPALTPTSVTSVTSPSIPDEVPPPPAASVMVAFASRRAAEAAAKEAAGKTSAPKSGPGKATPGSAAPGTATSGKAPALGAVTAIRTALPPRSVSPPVAGRPMSEVVTLPQRAAPAAVSDAADVAKQSAARSTAKSGATGKALRGLGALVTSPSIPGIRQRRPMVQASPSATAAAVTASAIQTAKPVAKPYGGGLGSRSMDQRSKPRYLGLILTGILLVFLALVAAWSTFFLSARVSDTAATEAVVDTSTDVSQTLPAAEDEMLADLQDPADFPDASAIQAEVAPPAAVEPAVPEAAPDTEITIESAAAAPPTQNLQDEIFLAGMDEAPPMPDALSLPTPAAQSDPPPGVAVPPPPFGTVYQFDAAGNILPTPEGILTPEGVLLIAGAPKLVPPPRPANLAAPTTATATADPATTAPPATDPALAAPQATIEAAVGEATAPLAAVEATFPADPALADARPRPRPATLALPTRNADDDASLAPATDSRFASLRPRLRPPEMFAATTAAAQAAAAAGTPTNLGAQAAALSAQASLVSASGPLSPLALTVSRKPAPRPQDMSRAVGAAVALASRTPEPRPETPAPQADAPKADTPRAEIHEDDAEPEIVTAMPRLPTKASVAKQATFVNAINLSKANLIGVYGTQSNRSALIRQPNGRYKKVQVGDSFDGGRVAAITASELRYQKSGKMHTLAMPKS